MENKFEEVVTTYHPETSKLFQSRDLKNGESVKSQRYKGDVRISENLGLYNPEVFFTAASIIKSCHLTKDSIITKHGFSCVHDTSVKYLYTCSKKYEYDTFHDIILERNLNEHGSEVLFISLSQL